MSECSCRPGFKLPDEALYEAVANAEDEERIPCDSETDINNFAQSVNDDGEAVEMEHVDVAEVSGQSLLSSSSGSNKKARSKHRQAASLHRSDWMRQQVHLAHFIMV
jgi:hypothetical protein